MGYFIYAFIIILEPLIVFKWDTESDSYLHNLYDMNTKFTVTGLKFQPYYCKIGIHFIYVKCVACQDLG